MKKDDIVFWNDVRTGLAEEKELILEELWYDSANLRDEILKYEFLNKTQKMIDDIFANVYRLTKIEITIDEIKKFVKDGDAV